jgi:hypothetical protein
VHLVESMGYHTVAIRDYQGNVPMEHFPVEVVPIDRIHLDGPPHGFNLLATKDPHLPHRLDLRPVPGVSPKLLHHRDPALHAPSKLDGN